MAHTSVIAIDSSKGQARDQNMFSTNNTNNNVNAESVKAHECIPLAYYEHETGELHPVYCKSRNDNEQ